MKNCSCAKKIPPGEISDKILNPLTTIKGYLQLNLNCTKFNSNEEVLLLLLSEVAKIEDVVNALEEDLDEKPEK